MVIRNPLPADKFNKRGKQIKFVNINTLSYNSSVLALLSRRNKDGCFLVLGSTVLKPDFYLRRVFEVSMRIAHIRIVKWTKLKWLTSQGFVRILEKIHLVKKLPGFE